MKQLTFMDLAAPADDRSMVPSKPQPPAPAASAVTLRPYQDRAVAWAMGSRPRARRLLQLPTGGGKTVIAAAIIRRSVALGRRVIFFAHRRELISQTRQRLIEMGMTPGDVGIMLGAETEGLDRPVVVASVQTWARRSPPSADLVFIDEAHRSLAPSYIKVSDHYRESILLGLTATPVGPLGNLYSEMLSVATPGELVDVGALARPRLIGTLKAPDLSGVRVVAGDYAQDELASRVNQTVLVSDLVATWERWAPGSRTVVFATSVEHSRNIAREFTQRGHSFEHLDGTTPTDVRSSVLAQLAAGEIVGVSNCAVLTEGWDCPSVKTVVLARPTKSLALFLQMIGRGLRPFNGETPVVLDHSGAILEHGDPMMDRPWKLTKSREKPKGVKSMRQCADCGSLMPRASRVCPECGVELTPQARAVLHEDRELVELDKISAADKDRMIFENILREWQRLTERCVRSGRPTPSRASVKFKFETKTGKKMPAKFVVPPLAVWTEDMARAKAGSLIEICRTRRIPLLWAKKKLREEYGDSEFIDSLIKETTDGG